MLSFSIFILIFYISLSHLWNNIEKIQIILAVLIAVIGWIITHKLTIRAQNKNFLNQVVNGARLEITKAIRDYQDWLGKIHTEIISLSYGIITEKQGIQVNWQQKVAKITEIFFSGKSGYRWIFCLEEHEILFPETLDCRKEMLARQRKIQDFLGSFIEALLCVTTPESSEKRKKIIEEAESNIDFVYDQIALMEDLRIYLQNRCLSSFTGNKVPERKPEDKSLPRLVQNRSGMLQISTKQKC